LPPTALAYTDYLQYYASANSTARRILVEQPMRQRHSQTVHTMAELELSGVNILNLQVPIVPLRRCTFREEALLTLIEAIPPSFILAIHRLNSLHVRSFGETNRVAALESCRSRIGGKRSDE